MKEYLATPPAFWAQQWDGTVEGAEPIVRAVTAHAFRKVNRIVVLVEYRDGEPRRWIEFDFVKGYIPEEKPTRMFAGDWVVLGEHEFLVLMPDDNFRKYYHPKENS